MSNNPITNSPAFPLKKFVPFSYAKQFSNIQFIALNCKQEKHPENWKKATINFMQCKYKTQSASGNSIKEIRFFCCFLFFLCFEKLLKYSRFHVAYKVEKASRTKWNFHFDSLRFQKMILVQHV